MFGSVSAVPSPVVYIQNRSTGGSRRTGPRATVEETAVSGRIQINVKTTFLTRLYVVSASSYVGSISSYFTTFVR